jgi:A/G-specific adenine glycosylase
VTFPFSDFSRLLATWFQTAQRDLPWRRPENASDGYRVLVSEMMLQQTTVAAATGFYTRFLARFPDIETLAAAPLDDVLAVWAGLGYYARARYLHAMAQTVIANGGTFPRDLESIQKLPGVGRYTAGAVASIAFDIPAPIVDANVARVFSRIFLVEGDLKKSENSARLWHYAEAVVVSGATQKIAPSQLNPALMELGALICIPRNPRCDVCPVESFCGARRENRQDELPFVLPKTAPTELNDVCVRLVSTVEIGCPPRSEAESGRADTCFWLRQRSHEKGIWWRGMWELPRTTRRDGETDADAVGRLLREELKIENFSIEEKVQTIKHGVTTFRIMLNCYQVRIAETPDAQRFSLEASEALAMPSTMRRLVRILANDAIEPRQPSLF